MKSWNYFQNFIRICLLCTIASLFVENGIDAGSEKSSIRRDADGSIEFKCANAKTVPSRYICDGDDDCGDGSDENKCASQQCNANQFRCDSGRCIVKSERCDGIHNCRDKSDEAECRNCSTEAFKCKSGQCVLGSYQCNSILECSDGSDEICPEGLIPSTWQENWHPGNANRFLTRVFANDDIGIYFDPDVNRQVNWFFQPFSVAWKYVKESYGPIGTNPILYIVFHEAKYNCATAPFSQSSPGHRTLLECGPRVSSGFTENTALFEAFFSNFGEIIREGAKIILNDADNQICEDEINDILFYDVYIHLKGEYSVEVLAWEARKQTDYVTVKGNKRYCFRDWFLPIYKIFGKRVVLNNYLQNTKSYWPQHFVEGYTKFNLGQWVHFWSGSAGADLQPLALKAFSWTKQNDVELKTARQTYRAQGLHYEGYHSCITVEQFLVPTNNYTLAYGDGNIAIKFENYRSVTDAIYKTLSDTWQYVKSVYNTHSQNLLLEVIFEDQDDRYQPNCVISQNAKLTSNFIGLADEHGQLPLYGYRMNCGKSIFQKWGATLNGIVDDMSNQMALTHFLVAKDDATGKNKEMDKSVQAIISDLNLQYIMVYDFYVGLGLNDDADRWRLAQSGKRNNYLERSTHLFRDWYLEIYKSYDTAFPKIVKEFVQLINERFHSTLTNKKVRRMNVGEFVHFWSGAVQENLIDLAGKCFKWKSKSIKQFNEARKNYPGLNDECEDCSSSASMDPGAKAEPHNEPHTIAIVVGVSATILIAAFICFGIKFVTDRRRIQNLNRQIRNLSQKELDDFYHGNSNLGSREAHAPIHSLPFKNEFEVPREKLIIDEKRLLGSGAFGIVKRGLLLGDDFLGTKNTVVAVKTLKRQVDIVYFKAQLLEIKIMAYLGKHENIVSLLATVTKNIIKCEVYIALEFCAKGDLYQYLNKLRAHFTDLWNKYKRINNQPSVSSSGVSCGSISDSNSQVTIPSSKSSRIGSIIKYRKMPETSVSFSTLDLLTWSRQIASGMEYLGLKDVIHGDLAARNVLLTSTNVAKISDFGLSRQLVNYSHYLKTSTMPVPWRWLAIESLTQMMFSPNSDIWSFGVTLWELFTLGNLPYQGRHWDREFVSGLNAGLRLDTPDFGNQEIYNLMLNCMKKEPVARMPFSQIGAQLEKLKANLVQATTVPSTYSSHESNDVYHILPTDADD